MNGYNLTNRQKDLLRNLVRCVKEEGSEEPISASYTFGQRCIRFFDGTTLEYQGDLFGDLDALCDADLMGFRYSTRGDKLYNIKQAGYDAVDNDFEAPLIPESPTLAQPTKGISVEERRAHLQALLEAHKRNLSRLELKTASHGLYQDLNLQNQMEYELAEFKRLEQELSALEETRLLEDDVIEADMSGSAVVLGGEVEIVQYLRSEPISEVLEELSRIKETIADLTAKFGEATTQRVVAASILGNMVVQQEEDLCFVLMPFGDDMLQQVYEVHIKPTVERMGLQCKRADDVLGPAVIMEDIWKRINSARVVLAELTGQNPNVFYELGLCHAIGKDAILMAQDIKWVPFDVRHRRTIIYTPTPRGCKQLEEVLEKTLEEALGKASEQ